MIETSHSSNSTHKLKFTPLIPSITFPLKLKLLTYKTQLNSDTLSYIVYLTLQIYNIYRNVKKIRETQFDWKIIPLIPGSIRDKHIQYNSEIYHISQKQDKKVLKSIY